MSLRKGKLSPEEEKLSKEIEAVIEKYRNPVVMTEPKPSTSFLYSSARSIEDAERMAHDAKKDAEREEADRERSDGFTDYTSIFRR